MRMIRTASFMLLAIALLPAAVFAARGDELVHATLHADVSAIEPGQTFRLGVLLKIDPSWHIYWKNPGDSGLPTRVKLDLPPGFTAGDVQYPVPKKLILPGDITAYVYEDEVMLIVPVTAEKDIHLGDRARISATVKWLVCQEQCLPGKATVNLDLPLNSNSVAANSQLFANWSNRVPILFNGNPPRQLGIASWTNLFDRSGHTEAEATVAVSWWSGLPKDVDWYPGPHPEIQISDVQMTKSELGRPPVPPDVKPDADSAKSTPLKFFPAAKVSFKARWLEPVHSSYVLDSIVAFTSADGERRGVEVPIKLVSEKQAKSLVRSEP